MVGACGRHPDRGPRLADGRQAGPDGELAGDEVGPAGSAACLGVVVGEEHALGGQRVEMRRSAGHDPAVIGAEVEPAHIVRHDDHDVRLLARCDLLGLDRDPGCDRARHGQKSRLVQGFGTTDLRGFLPGEACRQALRGGRPVEWELTRRGDVAENCACRDEQERGNPVSIHAENSRAKLRNRSVAECDRICVRAQYQASRLDRRRIPRILRAWSRDSARRDRQDINPATGRGKGVSVDSEAVPFQTLARAGR